MLYSVFLLVMAVAKYGRRGGLDIVLFALLQFYPPPPPTFPHDLLLPPQAFSEGL